VEKLVFSFCPLTKEEQQVLWNICGAAADGAPSMSPTSASTLVYNSMTQINVDKSIQLRFGSLWGHQGEGLLWHREGEEQGACGVYAKLSEVHLGGVVWQGCWRWRCAVR
jgi:hypothetical protein